MPKRRLFLSALAVAATAPVMLRAQGAPTANLADIMMNDGRFGRFLELVTLAGRMEMLRDAGRFTVLAPTNGGIDTIPLHVRNTMSGSGNPGQSDRGAVTNFVDLHIVEGVTSLGQLTSGPTNMRTLNGAIVQISGGTDNAHMVQVSQAGVPIAGLSIARNGRIIGPVLTATNGIVLPLDTALLT